MAVVYSGIPPTCFLYSSWSHLDLRVHQGCNEVGLRSVDLYYPVFLTNYLARGKIAHSAQSLWTVVTLSCLCEDQDSARPDVIDNFRPLQL